jgi:tetratricopeptide (TPR) repeat protein
VHGNDAKKLGALQQAKNKNEQAETYYLESMKLYQDLAAVDPLNYLPEVATSFNLFGSLQRTRKKYTQAEVSYMEALKIWRDLTAKDPKIYLPNMVMAILNLALLYQNDMPNKEMSVQYAKEVISYQADLEDSPIALPLMEIAKSVLKHWKVPTS